MTQCLQRPTGQLELVAAQLQIPVVSVVESLRAQLQRGNASGAEALIRYIAAYYVHLTYY